MATIQLQRALACDGYMCEAELRQLAVWASSRKTILEIGSYMGRSTRALADHAAGRVVAIDDFGGLRELSINPPPYVIREAFHRNLADHLASGKVTLYEASHTELARLALDLPSDMVFIDGSHDYASVTCDILACIDACRGGGLLCGHDFDVEHYEVMMAVDELLPGYRVIPATSLWWWIKPKL